MRQLLSIILLSLSSFFGFAQSITTPATQCSNVTITNITTTSFKVNWTLGSGARSVVVVRIAGNPNAVPSNANMASYPSGGTYLQASGNLGNTNYVVDKTIGGTSTTVSGLTPNVNYEVVVYSYNYGCLAGYNNPIGGGWICSAGNGYLINTSYSSSNSEQHYTLANEPTTVSNISVVGTPGATTATLSTTGTGHSWNLVSVRNSSLTGYAPIDGTYYSPSTSFGSGAQIGGTGTLNYATYFGSPVATINLTNLQPATTYWARAFSANGTGSISNNSYNYYSWSSVQFSTYNTPPTLNAISNYTICEDAAATNLSLSNIGDGSTAETQTVSIAAYSSNTALMPNPIISYTHPNPTGTLTFKPNSGQSGTVVITVVAQDGGPNNNATTRTFTVVVKGRPASAGTISTATTTLCKVKNGVVFTVPAIANANTYNWALPPNSTVTAGANTNSITVNFSITANSYNVSVFGSNTNGCGNGSVSPSILINFDNVPTVANAGSNQQICNNLTALAANTPSIGTGAWTSCSSGLFNINPTSAPNANLTVLDNATVTAVWTVTNGVCPSSSSTVTVTNIKGSPSCTPYAEFVANNTEICINSTVTFSNTSVAAVGVNTYTWNFGAGATPATLTSTASAITVTYSSVGTKTVTLSMNSGVGDLTETKNAFINVITVPTAPTSISGNTTVCQGKTAEPYFINLVTNATDYNWTFPSGIDQNTGSNTNLISANFSTTAVSGNIGVAATNACGSSSITTLSVTVNPLPTKASIISGTNTVCQGETGVVYIANNLNNGLSYTWTTPNGANIVAGLNTRTITVNYDNTATTGTMSVYGTNGCGDGDTRNKPITVNVLPEAAGTITGSTDNSICPLSTNVNYSITSLDNATSYAWVYPNGYTVASGNNTNSIFLDASLNTSSGVIKVVGKNACGNGDTSNVLLVNIDQLPTQQLCVATVDSSSIHNEIFWQKNGASNVDSFRVYRVQSSLIDTLIGTVDYEDLSKLVDVNSNPNVTSYIYKIAAVDFCGNEGPKSLEHKTIHLVNNYSGGNMNLSWNKYEGAVVINYRVLRDTNNSGNWIVLINSIPPNVYTYTDFNIPAGANSVQYRVDVIWANSCDPTAKVAQSIVNTTKSNTKDFVISIPTDINAQNDLLNSISLFPNPTKDVFEIELKAGLESFDIEIYSQLGSLLKSNHVSNSDKTSVDISEFSSGIYFVVVKTKMGSVTKRISKL